MLLKDFDYDLPQKLISQKPIKPRDHARLLILDKNSETIEHKRFFNIIDCLEKGDVIVLNNSKVIPARLLGRKEPAFAKSPTLHSYGDGAASAGKPGGRVEVFLLTKISPNTWEVLIRGKIRLGQKITLDKKITAVVAKINRGNSQTTYHVKFNASDKKIFSIGETPSPPYIKKKIKMDDYQTIYAKSEGSVAAPTAGLHFTKNLISKLKKRGIKIKYITLHVGLGTFLPVKSADITKHNIHSEFAILDSQTADELNKIKESGGNIIACGTTTVRTLEAFSDKTGKLRAQKKWIDIFIYPGYKFKFVDSIITNFHLPKSTLLMLISAFTDRELIMQAYKKAIAKKYRFYSLGDAMLIK